MLRDNFNDIYIGNEHIDAIINAVQPELDFLNKSAENNFNDNFAITATLKGIENYEKILSIVPDIATETIEFRRARVINKLAMLLPYTKFFLQNMLNTVFGPGNWSLFVDNDIYTIYLDIETFIPGLYEKTIEDIKTIIPANLIMITTKRITMDVAKTQNASAAITVRTLTHYTKPVRRG